MNYSQLTIFNYKVSYYILRLFGLYWLITLYLRFRELKNWPKEIYEPVFWLQKIIYPEFPRILLFVSLLVSCGILLIITLFKQSYILNGLIFLLTLLVTLPVSANFGVHHNNHLIMLGFFLTLFLLPKNLENKDYKLIQYFYLGILMTYTLAGMSKILGTVKNVIKQSDKLTWISRNAAKLNTYENYWMADQAVPVWMKNLYAYENLWIILTVAGILTQFFCFLGAFNRKLLTFFMIFLFMFHWYTKEFVIADFQNASYFSLVIFFPYHILRPLFKKKETL